jgi:3-oxoacyl-[acyl-carrier protein] reductase
MEKLLKEKVALVTGASKGIGAGIAKALGAAGTSVVVNYSRSKESADKVVADIKKNGGNAVSVQGDVSKRADVTRIFSETKKAYGSLDVLVNNAGVFKFGPLESNTEEDIEWQVRTNYFGTLFSIQESLKYFGPKGGSIINISSIVSENPGAMMAVYSSTKGAIDTLTKGMARELGAKNIRVNAIAPGHTETDGIADLGAFEGEFGKIAVAGTPLGRFGKPEDIARAVLFLASEESSWITGEILRSSGGAKGVGY